MNDRQRQKLAKYRREVAFMNDNAADFPAGSPGKRTLDALAAVLDEIEAHAVAQVSGASGAQMSNDHKGEMMDDLTALMRKMNRAADAMEDEVPNIDEMFRLPRNRSAQNMVTTARQYKTDAAAHEAKFVEYGLPSSFLADLQHLINETATAAAARDTAVERMAGATGGIAEAVNRSAKLSRKLGAIVKNRYADDASKLAAFVVASHLERALQQPPTPPNS